MAIDTVLAAAPMQVGTPPDLSDDSSDAPIRWWFARMVNPAAGLHEKLTWFWHGLVTVSHDKVFWWNVEWQAHRIMRRYAMSSYRQLLKEITIAPAMLLYLDGDWSTVEGPNENYARELQELFSIGQANVTQANVSNGALALAGWHVNWDAATAEFIDESWAALDHRVPFLGRQVWRYDEVVDAACDHPAMPRYIADKLWRYLVGTPPTANKLSSLATVYRDSDLDTGVLAARIVRDPQFMLKRFSRPRYPVEWVPAAMVAAGIAGRKTLALEMLGQMGQVPFYPPSVAGWPAGDRWLSPSLALSRAALATESPAIAVIANAADPVAAALTRCSIYEVSAQTRTALTQVRNDPALSPAARHGERAAVLLALCLASPEFSLA